MCGVFGFILLDRKTIPQEMIQRGIEASNTLRHRGPDASSHATLENTFLAHTRLKVIDLSRAGTQPMFSQDRKVALAVNGEIYNHCDLRKQLRHIDFHSSSDSEVALHGLSEWGIEKLLNKMQGMYAGALLDTHSHTLHIFRDRVGIKPMYVGSFENFVVWSSELKAIEAFAAQELTIDSSAVLDFAALRYIPAPKSLYTQVQKLPAAHFTSINTVTGQRRQKKYWVVNTKINQDDNHTTLAEGLLAHLERSVRAQLDADVPLGILLSGGLDSGSIAALAAPLRAELTTHTVAFTEKNSNEGPLAKALADSFGLNHQESVLSLSSIEDPASHMRRWYDEPFSDISAIPTELVCKNARKHCTVALSGDGGDELFGGYSRYMRFQRYRTMSWLLPKRRSHLIYRRPPRHFADKLRNRLSLWTQGDPLWLYSALQSNPLPFELEQIWRLLEIADDYDPLWALRHHYKPELGARRSLQHMDFHTWLPDDILTKVDRVSMAHGLEVRVPILDDALCDFAFGLPESFLYMNSQTKGGFRFALRNLLPIDTLGAAKKGFSIPNDEWRKSLFPDHANFHLFQISQIVDNGVASLIP